MNKQKNKLVYLQMIIATIILMVLNSCQSSTILDDFKPSKQRDILAEDSRIELLWAEGKFSEGPTLDSEGAVLFTDIPNNRIMRYNPKDGKTSVWREEMGSCNGLKMTSKGILLICQGADGGPRQLAAMDQAGKLTVITNKINGKRYNSPNDVDVAPNGDIYFTDPRYSGSEKRDLDYEGVYVVRNGKVSIASKELQRPNGILISRDGKYAFIADNNHFKGGNRTLVRMTINKDGSLSNKHLIFSFRDDQRAFDGMALDEDGNIYATAGLGAYAGIYVFSPTGKQLAFIDVPENPTNCTFGGPQEANVLYFTAQVITGNTKPMTMGLYRITLKKKGHRLFPK